MIALARCPAERLQQKSQFSADSPGAVIYDFPRAIIESQALGCHQFLSKGVLTKNKDANGIVVGISDQRDFEGWSKVA